MGFVGDDGIDWDEAWDGPMGEIQDFTADPRKHFDYAIAELDRLPRGSSMLELGCGAGEWSQLWAKMGFKYCGIDGSAKAIARGNARHPELQLAFGNLREADYGEGRAAVFTNTVLQHTSLDTKKAILPKIRNSLIENGLLILHEKCDVETPTTFTREGWIRFIEGYGFRYISGTGEGDSRMGFLFVRV